MESQAQCLAASILHNTCPRTGIYATVQSCAHPCTQVSNEAADANKARIRNKRNEPPIQGATRLPIQEAAESGSATHISPRSFYLLVLTCRFAPHCKSNRGPYSSSNSSKGLPERQCDRRPAIPPRAATQSQGRHPPPAEGGGKEQRTP